MMTVTRSQPGPAQQLVVIGITVRLESSVPNYTGHISTQHNIFRKGGAVENLEIDNKEKEVFESVCTFQEISAGDYTIYSGKVFSSQQIK